jgi:hypothetical protein
MIQDRFDQLEDSVKNSSNIPDATKTELLNLLSGLKSEILDLSKTHSEDARSIATFTDLSTFEATRGQKKPQLIQTALHGLASSVEDFETTHPNLTHLVNRIAVILSNTGI